MIEATDSTGQTVVVTGDKDTARTGVDLAGQSVTVAAQDVIVTVIWSQIVKVVNVPFVIVVVLDCAAARLALASTKAAENFILSFRIGELRNPKRSIGLMT